nr:hypothetical protein Itr_chr05CG15940 [Ipomoea trifida]
MHVDFVNEVETIGVFKELLCRNSVSGLPNCRHCVPHEREFDKVFRDDYAHEGEMDVLGGVIFFVKSKVESFRISVVDVKSCICLFKGLVCNSGGGGGAEDDVCCSAMCVAMVGERLMMGEVV